MKKIDHSERFRKLKAEILRIEKTEIENHSKWCKKRFYQKEYECDPKECLKGKLRHIIFISCSNFPTVDKVFGYDYYVRGKELGELEGKLELYCRVWMGKHKLIKWNKYEPR